MIRVDHLAEVISFNQLVSKEIISWLGGLPSGNIQTIYSGFGDLDKHINKDIKRYEANNLAEEYFIQNYSPTGELFDPVLALHTIYDELLPVSNYEYYEQWSFDLRETIIKINGTKQTIHYFIAMTEDEMEKVRLEILDPVFKGKTKAQA